MDMKGKLPSFIFMCLLVILPLYAAGHLASVDQALSGVFDSAISSVAPTPTLSGPMPRELALRRVVDKTTELLESEGRVVDRDALWEIARIAERVGLQNRLSPSLILSLIHTESGFRRDAISPVGAVGLMQIQPATARQIVDATGVELPRGIRLLDPETNIVLGSGYLRMLIDRFGDLRTALAAYHVGPTEIGRRMTEGESFSDRYGKEIRVRDTYSTGTAPVTVPQPVAQPVHAVIAETIEPTQG